MDLIGPALNLGTRYPVPGTRQTELAEPLLDCALEPVFGADV